MYFMSTECGRPQGGGVQSMWTGGGGQKLDFFVDVINGWPICGLSMSRILLKYFEELVAGYGCFVDGALVFENLRPSTVH